MIEPSIEESIAIIEAIIEAALETTPIGPKMKFCDFDAQTQLMNIQGVMNVMKGLQLLGWRITRPLKVVE
jgi:hypothetical protein